MQKSPETLEIIRLYADRQLQIIACYQSLPWPLTFFGNPKTVVPILLRSLDARIDQPADLRVRIEGSPDGEAIPVKFNVGLVHGHKAPECDGHFYVGPAVAPEAPSVAPDTD
jgi:hypothetical protein